MSAERDERRDRELLAIAHAMVGLDHPIKDDTSAWARENLAQRDVIASDAACEFPVKDWRQCADRGLMRLLVPEEFGGAGTEVAPALLALEGLGHGCHDNGLSYALASQLLSTQVALTRFGSDEHRERWLPGLLDGTGFAAFAMTELESGSDAFALRTTAEKTSDGSYRINGHKAYITFAPICDMIIVFASTRPEAGSWGISAFVVDATTPGVTRSEVRPKMGMRTTSFGDITLEDVVVPSSALLGREGSGASIFTAVLDVERSYVFAPQVGAMQRQLEDTIEYARAREQGGHPIAEYQAVSHRIVAMKERHERSRLFLYRAAMAHVAGRDASLNASLAKIASGDAGIDLALDAAMIHGARGYVTEFEVERALRDAVGGLTYSGSSDVLRNLVARHLGVG